MNELAHLLHPLPVWTLTEVHVPLTVVAVRVGKTIAAERGGLDEAEQKRMVVRGECCLLGAGMSAPAPCYGTCVVCEG